ncbi:glycosyl hydrolase family 8 [Paenibacillus terrigena]|uniref:glycosyl hydrolase family 8 n=1 Tax=Paenibacillus terrigena TaxID=369333 RepID=UPI0028D12A16|nr:glycosyl hydrolase family 8 [Paenibacillus terrigena]
MPTYHSLRKRFHRFVVVTLVFMLLPFHVAGTVSANEIGNEEVTADRTMIATWDFKDAGNQGVISATYGAYQAASTIRTMGGPRFEYVSDDGLQYQGWDRGTGSKYWLATLSTKGFQHITLSSLQKSSGSGPRDFKVEISSDGASWTKIKDVTLEKGSYTCNSCKLVDMPLPISAEDQPLLYIRWIVASTVPTNAIENSEVGAGGSSYIKDIRVKGERMEGSDIEVPTINLLESPHNGAVNTDIDTQIMVIFSKNIAWNEGHTITIMDNENNNLQGISPEIINHHTLQINHPVLDFGKTYTVSIPKEMIQGKEDHIPLIRDISWSFTTQDSPFIPKSVNMTFNGDPKTSIALAWYTDQMTDTVVQVVEASAVQGGVFPETGFTIYTGRGEEINTFMAKGDRTTQTFTKFISHKAIADKLTPGTTYNFRVGNGTAWSPIGSFTTDTSDHQSYRFIAGSDSQASRKDEFEPWADTFRKAIDHIGAPKFLISAGDLVDNGDLEEQWQWLLGAAQKELLQVPYVPVLGGHEVQDYDGDETTPNNNFYHHFNLPKQVVSDTHEGSVYSFEYGDALYLVFNSQYQGALTENGNDVEWADAQFWDQIAWMKNAVAKSDKKWKFVAFHKSPYAAGDNSAQWEDDRVQFYKKYLIPAFDEMGIDLVFEAHDHMYMRSFQMYNDEVIPKEQLEFDAEGNTVNPKGTVYLMSNAFGNKFYFKNNQYELDENGEPREKLDENGNPIPYDDYFAAIDEQPEKKMFTDVSVSPQVLQFTAYTAAVEDEGKEGTVGKGLYAYDKYGIKRTDVKPDPVEHADVKLVDSSALLSWTMPSASKEPIRGFRIYEKNDKVKAHWSEYIPVVDDQASYSYKLENIDLKKKYDLIIKAVGTRMNSNPVEVSTIEGPIGNEPPSAPTGLQGTAISPFQVNLRWVASAGTLEPSGYNVYRDGKKVGITKELSYSDTGLNPNTKYQYVVKAYTAEGLESLDSNPVQVTTRPLQSGEGPHKAFPQHTSYAGGSIKPNHVTQAEMDKTVAKLYDEWKAKYLKQNPYDPSQYYVWYSDGDWFEDNEITVSEAHGYGMLITALMAGHDPKAQHYFDSLYRYFRAHPSEINPELMAWQQADTGTEIKDINGVDSATDGDMDISYALLLANSQWGSNGEIDYLKQAKKVMNAIMQSEVNHIEWTLKLADWVTDNDEKYGKATRSSDFMMQHLKDYRNVTGDTRWDRVIDSTYNIIRSMHENYSPQAGLLPDFVVKDGNRYVPAEPLFLESETDGDYSYNSSRIPWRIGTDYLITGDTRAKAQLSTLNRWIQEKTKQDPKQIRAGYKLDGSTALEDYEDISFSAPMMVSAMIDSSNQAWLNRLWDYNTASATKDELYFSNNLRLLSMIVVSGNWWTPTIVDDVAPTPPTIERGEAISSSAVELRWTPASDNVGVVGYKVYRDDVEIHTTTKTDFKDIGLKPATTYRYFVVAVDAAGNTSKISNVRMITTLKQSSEGGGNGSGGTTTKPETTTPPVKEGQGTDTPGPVKKTFTDVDNTYVWAKEAIEGLAAAGIMPGTSETKFEPGKKLTRADYIALLVKLLGLKVEVHANFTDVDHNDNDYVAIGISKSLGITTGVGNNMFKPKALISRQEMMVLTARALYVAGVISKKGGNVSDLASIADASQVAAYAAEDVAALLRERFIQVERGSILPKETVTRAEAAVILYRIFQFIH